MAGGLMQLVAYGAQDVFLTGTPEITFWKVSYRRHTNFAMESIEQTFQGQADFGRRVTCTISRNGDLCYRTYLQVTLPEISQSHINLNGNFKDGVYARWLDYIGEQLIKFTRTELLIFYVLCMGKERGNNFFRINEKEISLWDIPNLNNISQIDTNLYFGGNVFSRIAKNKTCINNKLNEALGVNLASFYIIKKKINNVNNTVPFNFIIFHLYKLNNKIINTNDNIHTCLYRRPIITSLKVYLLPFSSFPLNVIGI